jgi:hypothetical protein
MSGLSPIEAKKVLLTSPFVNNDVFSDMTAFITGLLVSLINLFIYIFFVVLCFFSTKVSQSGIVPTDSNFYPYTKEKKVIPERKIDIFNQTIDGKDLSMKISFPYTDEMNNVKETVLDNLYKSINKCDTNFFTCFVCSIISELITFNYTSLQLIFSNMNGFSEILIVLFGPIMLFLVFICLILFNYFYYFYSLLMNLKWFFKHNTNDGDDCADNIVSPPVWEDVEFGFFNFNFYFRVLLLVVFIIMYILCGFFFGLIPLICSFYCLFSFIGYSGVMNGEKVTVLSLFLKICVFYKVTLWCILLYIIVMNTSTIFGPYISFIPIIIAIILYYQMIPNSLFVSAISENDALLKDFSPVSNLKTLPGEQKGGARKKITDENLLRKIKQFSKKSN